MERAKIALSAEELRLVSDSSVIFLKNGIISKVYALFGDLSTTCISALELPPEVASIPPKIARGEAYKGLPYVMLDYPRYFTASDVLALRTFFWWGQYMSVTLHLKGSYQQRYARMVADGLAAFESDDVHIAHEGDEWDHDLRSGGYVHVRNLEPLETERRIREGSFLKLSVYRRLEQWNDLPSWLENTHKAFGSLFRS
jgi:hypothetical protein